MSDRLQQAVQAFANRDYRQCMLSLGPLLARPDHATIQLFLLCVQRVGMHEQSAAQASEFLRMLTDSWEQSLVKLTLGEATLDEVLSFARGDTQCCQAHYYEGARLLGDGHTDAARPEFEACLACDADCLERQLAECELEWLTRQPESLSPPEATGHVNSLRSQARRLFEQGRLEEAIESARNAVEYARSMLGEEHPEYVVSLVNLAAIYKHSGNYQEAESSLLDAKRAMRSLESEIGLVAEVCEQLGSFYLEVGRLEDAEAEICVAFQIISANAAGTAKHAEMLLLLAQLYRAKGDYQRAEQDFIQARDMLRRSGQEDPQVYGVLLHSLSVLYLEMGDFDAAEPFCEEAIEFTRGAFGEMHPAYAVSLTNMASLRHWQGQYAEGVRLYSQASQIQLEVLGENHPDLAYTLNNLAELYREMEDYSAARTQLERTLAIREGALGPHHPLVGSTLNNLAGICDAAGDHEEAESLLRKALDVFHSAVGEDHDSYANSLHNLAGQLQARGKYDEARSLLRQALEIRRDRLGEEHPLFARTLSSLAGIEQDQGDHAAAEPLLRQALEIKSRVLGPDNPDLVQTLSSLAAALGALSRYDEALRYADQTNHVLNRAIGEVFSAGSEAQRMVYVKTVNIHLDFLLTLVNEQFPNDHQAVRDAADMVLRRKAIGAEALAAQRDAVLSGRYPELEERLTELKQTRMQIARKAISEAGGEDPALRREQLAELSAQKDRLEVELAQQIPEMNLERELRNVDCAAIATAVPPDAVLVEFVRFRLFDFVAVKSRGERIWKGAKYVAFVIRHGNSGQLQMIDLGDADQIDQLVNRFRSQITGEKSPNQMLDQGEPSFSKGRLESRDLGAPGVVPQVAASSQDGDTLRQLLLDALVPYLGDSRRILIAPDGNLALLPFEVLPTADGDRVIDRYRISYLSVGRDLLRFSIRSDAIPNKPLVVADPDFDFVNEDAALQVPITQQGDTSRALKEKAIHFGRLPGTRSEGERVAALLGVWPLLERNALEAWVKASRSPQVLHIATHGFFLTNPRETDDFLTGLQVGRFNDAASMPWAAPDMENPLLRSGLALAGANTSLRGGLLPEEAEDGLLTAEDVSALDLSDTELAVLSACETGLGEVQVGEGVFGLRRAFMLAGAHCLVISLWKVPDEQTKELMIHFYERVLSGQPRADALRDAQLAVREKHPEPLYWGAFICQGNPAPMSHCQTIGSSE